MKLSLILLNIFAVNIYATSALKHGEVAYKLKHSNTGHLLFTLTDGTFVLKATVIADSDELLECRLHRSKPKAQKIITSKSKVEAIGTDKIRQMVQQCRDHVTSRVDRATSADDNDTFNHDLVHGKPFAGDFGTGAPEGAMANMAIFPGTKWCGYENNAQSMTDLGVHVKTDACCRTHDHCPYYIDRFESKYHYYNAYPWTISHCDCDQHLYNCLKSVNTTTSNEVGKLFFGLLNVKCFTFQSGQYCEDQSSVLSKLWCAKKVSGSMAVMQRFPHKWSEATGTEKHIMG